MYRQKLKSTIFENRFFYISCLLVWALGLYFQFSQSQFSLTIGINNSHTPIGDGLMVWMTNMGDGLFLLIIGVVLVLSRKNNWLAILLCLLLPSILTQLLKHFVFEDHLRPAMFMEQIENLHFIEGVKMNRFNSFPSGHTTAAFSLYTLLALITSNKKIGFMWPIIAGIVGLSRVYLLQHFWVDVLVGSIIGSVVCTLLFVWLQPNTPTNEI